MGSPAHINLLRDGAATGSSVDWPGGDGIFDAAGTWDGATCKLQFQPLDTSAWIDVGVYTTLTGDGGGGFTLKKCKLRAAVSGAGGSTSLIASVGAV